MTSVFVLLSKTKALVFIVFLLFCFSACSTPDESKKENTSIAKKNAQGNFATQTPKVIDKCLYPDNTKTEAPLWLCDPYLSKSQIAAVGLAPLTSAGLATAHANSDQNAREQLLILSRNTIRNLLLDFAVAHNKTNFLTNELLAASLSHNITLQNMSISKLYEKVISPNFIVYTLHGIDKKTLAELFEVIIKNNISEDLPLWSNFYGEKIPENLSEQIVKTLL